MKSIALDCLFTVALVAILGALGCAFMSFATNDYRPIIATGIGLSLLAMLCFAALVFWRRHATRFYMAVVLAPTAVALGELLVRAASRFGR
jgi:protein-S-isoprenylcysteine O-methyltransferase Ste14